MTFWELLSFLTTPNALTSLITLFCIVAMLWYTWLCSGSVARLCEACMQEIQAERETVPIIIQATGDMTPYELARLVREAEAINAEVQVA